MMLTSRKYDVKLQFHENEASVLIVEDPEVFSDMIGELQEETNGVDSSFVLSEGTDLLKIAREMELVIDPFSLDFNSRKMQQCLYGEWGELAKNCDVEKADINMRIVRLLEAIEIRSVYGNISYQMDFEWESLFKIYQVRFAMDFSDLEEKITEYIKLLSGLVRVKLLCFVNLKSYLSEEQLERIYQVASYNKLTLLLLENLERKQLKQEKTYIIDRDRCLIIK